MDCKNQKNNLEVTKKIFLCRILLSIIIFGITTINPWIRIVLLLSLDFIKNAPFLFCKDISNVSFSKSTDDKLSSFYQYYDKIIDIITYILCYIIIIQNKLLSSTLRNYILYILIYRIIGVTLYLITKNRTYLFYFVDLFKEVLLLFFIYNRGMISKSKIIYLFILIVLLKFYIEYKFHIDKQGIKGILKL